MDKSTKQNIINEATRIFRNRQWFNGAGFEDDTLILAYNNYPAFEMRDILETVRKLGVSCQLKDIRQLMPNAIKDDVPAYVK